MPRLILLNGPPACGKSTLARLYAGANPPALSLDIDRVRAMIGGWQENLAQAGLLARDIALASARTHLMAGHDVVIPQLVARPEFIRQLESLARDCDVEFREVFLLPDEQSAIAQYGARALALVAAAEPDPAISISQTPAELALAYQAVLDFLAARPAARAIRTRTGQVEQAYQALVTDLMDSPAG